MEKTLSKEWCRMTWQVILYLQAVYDQLDDQKHVKVSGYDWGTNFDEEPMEAEISISVKRIKIKRIKGGELWVGLLFTDAALTQDRPIWIEVIKNDQQLWKLLKDEFQDGIPHNDNENRLAIGLQWPLDENATNDQVKTAGQQLADRISRVLLPDIEK